MPEIELRITKHAKEKMVIHCITRKQIKIAIKRGARVKQTEEYMASYTYIKVAYRKIEPNMYKIKTVFVD